MANRTWSRQSKVGRQKFRRSKGWGVDLDQKTNQTVKALVEQAYPRTARIVERGLEKIRDGAVKDWPVKTGKSKDSIRIVPQISGDLYRLSLRVGAWYAALIRRRGESPGRVLILDKADQLADQLSESIAKEIAR